MRRDSRRPGGPPKQGNREHSDCRRESWTPLGSPAVGWVSPLGYRSPTDRTVVYGHAYAIPATRPYGGWRGK
jgi:hypothetical protein